MRFLEVSFPATQCWGDLFLSTVPRLRLISVDIDQRAQRKASGNVTTVRE